MSDNFMLQSFAEMNSHVMLLLEFNFLFCLLFNIINMDVDIAYIPNLCLGAFI